jgi:hypothetical protein
VTGDPLFSVHSTSGLAEELGRQRSVADIPSALPDFLTRLVKPPVWYAGLIGIALAGLLVPRRAVMPGVLLLTGVGTFGLVGLAGLSVIERYLLVPSLALMIFAGVAACGWTMLREGTLLRRAWAVLAAAVVLYGVFFTVTRVHISRFTSELRFRGDSHAALVKILHDPAVKAGLRCGPITVPNHKLIPDTRWILDLPKRKVLARSDPHTGHRADHGVALFVTNRLAVIRQAYTQRSDPATIQVPDPRFRGPVATSAFYSAYVRC